MKKTTPIYQINFNIDQIGQSILEWLQESIDSSFTTDDTHEGVVGSDELFHFRAKCKTRIIAIIILKSGRLDLYLEREDKDTFYSLTANDSEKDNEGVTTFQLANSVAIIDSGKIIALNSPDKLIDELVDTGFERPKEVKKANLEDVFISLTGHVLRED